MCCICNRRSDLYIIYHLAAALRPDIDCLKYNLVIYLRMICMNRSDHTNDHARQLILVRLFKFELNIPNYQAIEYDLFCQHLPLLSCHAKV